MDVATIAQLVFIGGGFGGLYLLQIHIARKLGALEQRLAQAVPQQACDACHATLQQQHETDARACDGRHEALGRLLERDRLQLARLEVTVQERGAR